MNGFYLVVALAGACFYLWPERSVLTLAYASYVLQAWFLNARLRWIAWRHHRILVKLCKEMGVPGPGPFVFVDIWDRNR